MPGCGPSRGTDQIRTIHHSAAPRMQAGRRTRSGRSTRVGASSLALVIDGRRPTHRSGERLPLAARSVEASCRVRAPVGDARREVRGAPHHRATRNVGRGYDARFTHDADGVQRGVARRTRDARLLTADHRLYITTISHQGASGTLGRLQSDASTALPRSVEASTRHRTAERFPRSPRRPARGGKR
jgi:hypothetical protein